VLNNGEFLYEQSLYPVTEYAFKHPLTQEVALGSQLRERRARTHAAVARALEVAHPDRLDEQAALLAHHWEAAGRDLDAARWHRRAAEWLIKSDSLESNTHSKRVYELAKSVPVTPETRELLLAACARLVMNSYTVDISEDEVDRLAAEGRELGNSLGDRAGLFMLELGLVVTRNLRGWSAETPLVPVKRAIEIAEDLGLEMQVVARCSLANTLWQLGRVPDAWRANEESIELAGSNLEFGVMLQGFSITNLCVFHKASLLMWSGRPGEAADCFEQCKAVAAERNEHEILRQMIVWSGPAFEELTGTSNQGLASVREAVEQSDRSGSLFDSTICRLYLGWAELMHGYVDEALASLLQVDHLQRERGLACSTLTLGQCLLAEAHLAAGDAASARTVANRCPAKRNNWVYELRAHLSRSRVLRALDGADGRAEIEASLAAAEQLLEKSGARAFGPFIVEERARLAAVLGDEKGASTLLRQARDLFVEVEATGHVARIADELGA
jgi:hypothetical protein